MIERSNTISTYDPLTLAEQIRELGRSLGFQAVTFADPSTEQHRQTFEQWLAAGYAGEMDWMKRNLDKRFDASALHPQTRTVICVRMDYWPQQADGMAQLEKPDKAYISRYALGRDYHKVMRKRLSRFAAGITELAGEHGARPFVDSAPVMERQLAEQSGLGWIGKNSLLLAPGHGSTFFLGELCTSLKLPADSADPAAHCGSCNQCLIDCPTDAFVSEGVLDATRCISYLTIEHSGAIPLSLRALMGNRIYGCDDCQLVCPHNRKAPTTTESDFEPRHQLDDMDLISMFCWDEATFLKNTEGSAIRRIGFEQWQRNLAVALGNGPATDAARRALSDGLGQVSELVDEHIRWALDRLG